jgi:hypothetical protein
MKQMDSITNIYEILILFQITGLVLLRSNYS